MFGVERWVYRATIFSTLLKFDERFYKTWIELCICGLRHPTWNWIWICKFLSIIVFSIHIYFLIHINCIFVRKPRMCDSVIYKIKRKKYWSGEWHSGQEPYSKGLDPGFKTPILVATTHLKEWKRLMNACLLRQKTGF